eukprot:8442411-Alexandrium_andersonii.AAC.1
MSGIALVAKVLLDALTVEDLQRIKQTNNIFVCKDNPCSEDRNEGNSIRHQVRSCTFVPSACHCRVSNSDRRAHNDATRHSCV